MHGLGWTQLLLMHANEGKIIGRLYSKRESKSEEKPVEGEELVIIRIYKMQLDATRTRPAFQESMGEN